MTYPSLMHVLGSLYLFPLSRSFAHPRSLQLISFASLPCVDRRRTDPGRRRVQLGARLDGYHGRHLCVHLRGACAFSWVTAPMRRKRE